MRHRGRQAKSPRAPKDENTTAKEAVGVPPRAQIVLALVACDRTFEPAQPRGGREHHEVWVGKCIHCRASLVVDPRSPAEGLATLEHMVPRSSGGGHRADNLALACARCNHQKGSRLDPLGLQEPRLGALIERLQQERLRRLRPPDPRLALPAHVARWLQETS